jgi:hypothetical protein
MARRYQEPGLAWLERQAELAEELIAQRQAIGQADQPERAPRRHALRLEPLRDPRQGRHTARQHISDMPFDRRSKHWDRQLNGVAVSRTSGPMRTTSSSRKRLASAILGAPGPASADLPPPPIRTGAM